MAGSALEKGFRQEHKLLNEMNCGIVERDPQGRIVFMNERLQKWLGYSREEILGEPVEILVPPEIRDLLLAELEAVEAGDVRARLTVVQRKDSSTFPVLTIPQRLLDEDGRPAGGFSVIIELGAIQTAKQAGYGQQSDLRGRLERIAFELQAIGLSAGVSAPMALPLEHPELAELSPREREILAMLVRGDRVPAIAKELHISPHTVRSHLKAVYRKLDVKSQAALIERVRALAQERQGGTRLSG